MRQRNFISRLPITNFDLPSRRPFFPKMVYFNSPEGTAAGGATATQANSTLTSRYFDQKQKMLHKLFSRFGADLLSKVAETDARGTPDEKVLKKMKELGFYEVAAPGDARYPKTTSFLLHRELAHDPAYQIILTATAGLLAYPIEMFGTEKQRQEFMPLIRKGAITGCYMLTESESGSDAFGSMRMTGRQIGDYVALNGEKAFITEGDKAGWGVVYFKMLGPEYDSLPQAEKYKCIKAILVPRSTGKLISLPEAPGETFADGFEPMPNYHKTGMHASGLCNVNFPNVLVHKKYLLPGKGYKIAMEALNSGRITIAAQACGITDGICQEAAKFAKDRESFGGKKIYEFDMTAWNLADMAIASKASTLMGLWAAKSEETKESFVREAAEAKLFCSEACLRVAQLGVHVQGGTGFIGGREGVLEALSRASGVTATYEGTSEMQKIAIAKELRKENLNGGINPSTTYYADELRAASFTGEVRLLQMADAYLTAISTMYAESMALAMNGKNMEQQGVQAHIAEMAVACDAVESVLREAAWSALSQPNAYAFNSAVAKVFASEQFENARQSANRMRASLGVAKPYSTDAVDMALGAESDDNLKKEVIARQFVEKYGGRVPFYGLQ